MAGTVAPSAPLRNQVILELDAPPDVVWELIGNLSRFPEYSAGLERVEATLDDRGRCTEYVCRFRPQAEGNEAILHREVMRWYEPRRGWASNAEEPNAFGLTDAVTLVTLDRIDRGTRLSWQQHYNASDLAMLREVFEQALDDIARRLIERFGGELVEPG